MTTDLLDELDFPACIDPLMELMEQKRVPIKDTMGSDGLRHFIAPLSDLVKAFRYAPPPRVKNPVTLLDTPRQLMARRIQHVVCLSAFVSTCGLFYKEPAAKRYAAMFANTFIVPGIQGDEIEKIKACFPVPAVRVLLAEHFRDSIRVLRIPGARLEISGGNVVAIAPGQQQLNLF